MPTKNAVRNLGSLPSAPCKLQNGRDGQNPLDSGSPKVQTSGDVSMKKDDARIANNPSDHQPIKVRIRMGSQILSRKVAVVNKNLGLEDHLNSHLPNSHDDSSRMLARGSIDMTSECPSSILKEMTSVPVPDELLMSPLPDTLLRVMERPRQEPVADSENVVKAQKKPYVLPRNKVPDDIHNGKPQCGKKRRLVDSFDATTCNENPSHREIKKQRKISTSQLTTENSTCGFLGASLKDKLQTDIYKGGGSDREVTVRKSNPIKVCSERFNKSVKLSSEESKKAPLAKSNPIVSNNRCGPNIVPEVLLEDATACTGRNIIGAGLACVAGPPAATLELDNWVQCDSCETWRLLPFGLKPEQLPDKWLCSMQSWLPGMNHCRLSEEETTNAVKALHLVSSTTSHALDNGVINRVFIAGQAGQIYQPLHSDSLPDQIKKKSIVKNLSRRGLSSSTPVKASGLIRRNLEVPVQMKHSASQMSKLHEQESESSRKSKVDDRNKISKIRSNEIPRKLNLERDLAEGSRNPYGNGVSTYEIEPDMEKIVPAVKKTVHHQPQPATGGDSSASKDHDRTIGRPAKKKRLIGLEYDRNGNDSKKFPEGESKVGLNKKGQIPKASIDECRGREVLRRNEMYQTDSVRELKLSDTSVRYLSSGSGLISGVTTSSNSKALELHRSGRAHVEEIKASSVDSVSSSSTKSSCLKTTSGLNQLQGYPSKSKHNMVQLHGPQETDATVKKSMDKVANDVLKEADKLRKLADCFKSSGFEHEHKETNFKAVLKFLYGASLLETCGDENVLNGNMGHVEAYHTAAKLSQGCAIEYETSQELAAAALAYKCMEVACMRVVYSTSFSASRDWINLQKLLQMAPKDIDSFVHHEAEDKPGITMGSDPEIAGGYLIDLNVAKALQNFVQQLGFAEDMSLAMEASTKAQNALRSLAVTSEDGVSCIKRVVDFSFHDVEGLIGLIELAVDGLSH